MTQNLVQLGPSQSENIAAQKLRLNTKFGMTTKSPSVETRPSPALQQAKGLGECLDHHTSCPSGLKSVQSDVGRSS
jgi:hypothetical protein